jgi:hypothetical protein
MPILAAIIGELVRGDVVLESGGLGLGEALVRAQVRVTLNNYLPFFAGEVDLAEAIVDEGVAPVVHEFMLYPNDNRSQ